MCSNSCRLCNYENDEIASHDRVGVFNDDKA